jgi:hypothetical protein
MLASEAVWNAYVLYNDMSEMDTGDHDKFNTEIAASLLKLLLFTDHASFELVPDDPDKRRRVIYHKDGLMDVILASGEASFRLLAKRIQSPTDD